MGAENSTEGGVVTQRPQHLSDNPKDMLHQPTGPDALNADGKDSTMTERLVRNVSGGFSFKVCDINRLRRFIVLGSETNTYYSTKEEVTIENIICVKNLLEQKRHVEVLDIITEYSVSGRVPKEDPILAVLGMCATHADFEVRKAAFGKLVQICNIPTKLFKFLDITQDHINDERRRSPPQPQVFRNQSKNKRKRPVEKSMEELKIEDVKDVKVEVKMEDVGVKVEEEDDDVIIEEEIKMKVPSENVDTTLEPVKKKVKKVKKEPEFKKVNKDARKSSGWGRMRRKSVAAFYVDEKKDASRLLQLLSKYRSRHDWNHKQVLTYAHPKVDEHDKARHLVLKYATLESEKVKQFCEQEIKKPGINEEVSQIIQYIMVIEEVAKLAHDKPEDLERLLEILKQYGIREKPKEFATATTMTGDRPKHNFEGKKSSFQIVREHLPTGFLKSIRVWEALLQDMPMTALIRNLGKMSSMKMFDDNEKNVELVVNSVTNPHKLKTARVHPMKILLAMTTYNRGQGVQGNLSWVPNEKIAAALDKAFYLSFKQPEVQKTFKTGLRYMLALDVSGSMTFRGCVGTDIITPAMAAAAMAWVTWNVEGDCDLVAFGSYLEDMKARGFDKDMRINDVVNKFSSIRFGATDCSLPMVHALQKKMQVDVFIVYTDCETNCNKIPPAQALLNYNKAMNKTSKLIVCGLQSNGFTVADPHDSNMMDVVGFDANVPELISEFSLGRLSGKCSETCKECNEKI